jgi:hypothetical protein
LSVVRHPAGGDRANPASAGPRGVARPPRGRTPRTPRTPRAPLGARGRARGPAGWPPRSPRGRPVADRHSRGSGVVMERRLADRAAVPGGPRGRGGPLTAASWVTAQGPHDSHLSSCHVIQRERPQPFPGMSRPATAGLRATAGRSRAPRGPRADVLPLRWGRRDLRSFWRILSQGRTTHSHWSWPSGGDAARPSGALRAVDSSACPRCWRTCGPHRLRRQSQPDLAATQRGRAIRVNAHYLA